MILIQRNELCRICTKVGRYIRGMSPSKADGNKRFISLAKDHQKVVLPVSYRQGTVLVSTSVPAYPI
jgi:hypothetical protein